MALPRKTAGLGAICYSLKMARHAGDLWPMLRALTSRNNFIEGRTLHTRLLEEKLIFKVCPIPAVRKNSQNRFILMTVRPEGQFNTVVYDTEDRYRGISGRNFVLMNEKNMATLDLAKSDRITVKNATGMMTAQKAVTYPIKEGNILVPRDSDPKSKTPSFKSIEVILEKE